MASEDRRDSGFAAFARALREGTLDVLVSSRGGPTPASAPLPATPSPPSAARAASRLQGLSLAGFDALIAAAGGRAALEVSDAGPRDTGWLKHAVVKPATAAAACSFADLLRARDDGARLVGPAHKFISHAYGYSFLTVYDAVAAWEARQGAAAGTWYYYYDLAVVNQHGQTMGVSPEVLWAEFAGGVERVGDTLLVLTWGESAFLPLTRAWCLAEIVTGLGPRGGGAFAVIMPPADEARFRAALLEEFDTLVAKTCTIHLARATAYHGGECLLPDGACRHVVSRGPDRIEACPNDLAFVRGAIAADMGFVEADRRVVGVMREWMAGAGRAALEAQPPGPSRDASDLHLAYARLLAEQGKLEAIPLLQAALAARAAAAGSCAPATAMAQNACACALRNAGRLAEALALFREAHAAHAALHGEDDERTLRAQSNMLTLQRELGGDAQELLVFHRNLAARLRRLHGDDHADTIAAVSNYATLLVDLDDPGAAEPLLREVLARRLRALGPVHPDTLTATFNVAVVLTDQGDYEGAAPLFHEALEGHRRTLGDAHPETLGAMRSYANALRGAGDVAGAEELLERALEGTRRALGDRAEGTLEVMSSLATLLRGKGDAARAERLSGEALAGFEALLGAEHPKTLLQRGNYANLLSDAGRHASALREYAEVVAGYRRAVGDAHTRTLTAIRHFAIALENRGKHARALPLFCEALRGRRRVLGDAHGDTLQSFHECARALERALGEAHPAAVRVTVDFCIALEASGQEKEMSYRVRRLFTDVIDADTDGSGSDDGVMWNAAGGGGSDESSDGGSEGGSSSAEGGGAAAGAAAAGVDTLDDDAERATVAAANEAYIVTTFLRFAMATHPLRPRALRRAAGLAALAHAHELRAGAGARERARCAACRADALATDSVGCEACGFFLCAHCDGVRREARVWAPTPMFDFSSLATALPRAAAAGSAAAGTGGSDDEEEQLRLALALSMSENAT
jgi:tetratricopeptide (TPR) repeat protein